MSSIPQDEKNKGLCLRYQSVIAS